MKAVNLLLLGGIGFLAFQALKGQNNSGYSGGYAPTQPHTTFNLIQSSEQQERALEKQIESPIKSNQASLDLSMTPYNSPLRFTAVEYSGGVGVLDRAKQQSITVQEAQKRASSPFSQIDTNPYKKYLAVNVPAKRDYGGN